MFTGECYPLSRHVAQKAGAITHLAPVLWLEMERLYSRCAPAPRIFREEPPALPRSGNDMHDFSLPTTAAMCDACPLCSVQILALQANSRDTTRYVAVKVKTNLPDAACASDHITILRDELVLDRFLHAGDECWIPALNACEQYFSDFKAHVFTGIALHPMPRGKQQPSFSGFRIDVKSDLWQFLGRLRSCFPVRPAPLPFHISRDFAQVPSCRARWDRLRILLRDAGVSQPWLWELD